MTDSLHLLTAGRLLTPAELHKRRSRPPEPPEPTEPHPGASLRAESLPREGLEACRRGSHGPPWTHLDLGGPATSGNCTRTDDP